MIIFRYLVKEVVVTVAATTGLLMLIFMSTQFVHYLGGAAIGRYTAQIIFHIMLLQIPYLLALLTPLGFFLALLMAYGRLYADREMTILSCSGLSQLRLLKMTLAIATVVVIIVSIFSLGISPMVTKAQKTLIDQARNAPVVDIIFPGRFFSMDGGKQVFYMAGVSRDHQQFQGIFMAQQDGDSDNRWSIVAAAHGYQQTNPANKLNYLYVNDGHRYLGTPGKFDFQNQQFDKFSLRLDQRERLLRSEPEIQSTWQLLHERNNLPAMAELQWRISTPLSVFILAILAVPMCQVNPRQGKFAQLLPSILIYIIYANMMFVARDWLTSGNISPYLGLWWLHGLLFLLAIFLFWYRSGVSTPLRRRLERARSRIAL
jgi:lipopolysaccharide export system permease protein